MQRSQKAIVRLVAITFGLAIALASLASASGSPPASIQDVQAQCSQAQQGINPCSTDYTPTATPAPDVYGWKQVGGAVFGPPDSPGAPQLTPGSFTPFTVDFYGVSFRGQSSGLAVGAACADGTPFAQLATCTRYPQIWRYTTDTQGTGTWSEVAALPGADQPGYIGAVAWIAPGEALAVGGSGTYVRRETGNVDDPAYADPAGQARAWLLQDGTWQELRNLPAMQHRDGSVAPMRGLDAVACSPTQPGFCVAGGLGQLWMFHDGRFTNGYDDQSPDTGTDQLGNANPGTELQYASQFRFRVRAIAFNTVTAQPEVVAVTAGCCSTVENNNQPDVLTYDGSIWHSEPPGSTCGADTPGVAGSPGVISGVCVTSPVAGTPRTSTAFSFEDFTFSGKPSGSALRISLLASPDGPLPADGIEPSSYITNDWGFGGTVGGVSPYGTPLSGDDNSAEPARDPLQLGIGASAASGFWLSSGDGDVDAPCTASGCGFSPDGYMDWAVGEITAGPDSGEAAAYTTAPNNQRRDPSDQNYALSCSGEDQSVGTLATCKPRTPQEIDQQQVQSDQLFALGSYALNGYTLADPGRDVGWAVGDRGALWRRGGEAPSPPPPLPPKLGQPSEGSLGSSGAYQLFEPSAGDQLPGTVPPLSARPDEPAHVPELVDSGSPNPRLEPISSGANGSEAVASIAMSPDGSEGWAVGPAGSGSLTLYHYIDGRWSRCDPVASGLMPADLACENLAPLLSLATGRVELFAVATVPSTGPAAAGGFQAVAVGCVGSGCPGSGHALVLRYAGGLWSVDRKAMAELARNQAAATEVGFTAPDDGWIVGYGAYVGPGTPPAIYHFDGRRWIDCNPGDLPADPDIAECGDSAGLLPFTDAQAPDGFYRVVHLAAVGHRVYLYGARAVDTAGIGSSAAAATTAGSASEVVYPMILYRDHGGSWTGQLPGHSGVGAYDPGCVSSDATGACQGTGNAKDEGEVSSLGVSQTPDGSYQGWAVGQFGGTWREVNSVALPIPGTGPAHALLQLGPSGWSMWTTHDAADEYLLQPSLASHTPISPGAQLTLRDGSAILIPNGHPPLRFDSARRRWEVLPAPFFNAWGNDGRFSDLDAVTGPLGPDGGGGFWLAATQNNGVGYGATYFFHYTEHVPSPVFSDVAQPIRQPIHGLAAGPGGTLWAAADGATIYHYDRLTGWDSLRIPGWDSGTFVSAPSPVYAVAVGPGSEGVAVGKSGRIADLVGTRAILDRAAGTVCDLSAIVAPCGTSRDLRAAAVAPNGAAIVGGDNLALLWRPPGGQFRAITEPPAALSSNISAVALPTPNQAWLALDNGEIVAGSCQSPCAGDWSWRVEDMAPDGSLLSLDSLGRPLALRAIAIDASGHGFAVGDRGLVLERTGDPQQPWRRLNTGYLDDLTSVTLPWGGGPGALIGGLNGLILTWVGGRFQLAEPASPFAPITGSAASIIGLALEPGDQAGQVEAWAATQAPYGAQQTAILHYSSDSSDPLLDGGMGRARALPDAPARQPGEVRFAAFGKSDCQLPPGALPCPEDTDTSLFNELVLSRIVDVLSSPGQGLQFALYTGDALDTGGKGDLGNVGESTQAGSGTDVATPVDESLVQDRFADLVAQPLDDAGVPLYGALGGQDLSGARTCLNVTPGACQGTAGSSTAWGNAVVQGSGLVAGGISLPWRAASADQPLPWGAATRSDGSANTAPPGRAGVSFGPVSDPLAVAGQPVPSPEGPTVTVSDPSGTLHDQTVSAGGAHTHYAFDLLRNGRPLLRVVVVDSSLRSLESSDGDQNPIEEQLAWLERVLGDRPEGERAAVVSETPSYSFGPGAGSDTLSDSSAFEQLMLEEHVSVVVSGREGWNAIYYTFAAGVHCPQPGAPEPDPMRPPSSPADCASGAQQAQDATSQAQQQLASVLVGTGAPAAPSGSLAGYPTVIAASAGGKFGPDGSATGSASDGYWHGYSLVRLMPNGQVVVEQRPVFDWIGMSAISHTLAAGQHLQLHGFGREPAGTDEAVQYDEIGSPAITHRYDLVAADPAHPWLPLASSGGGYVPLDPAVATVDPQSGFIQTGSGSHPRVYAIAILSVGSQAASWPMVFEPSRSFVSRRPILPQLPPVAPPVPLPAAHLAAAAPAPPAPPSSAPPSPPEVGTPSLPQLPSLSPPPPVAAVSPPAPPPPPPPPPPPSQPTPLPLALQAKLSPVGINATVVPPSPPPVNPAPPSGSAARKEAKQRQAATAKSEEGMSEAQEQGGDLAEGRPGAPGASAMTRRPMEMTRRDRVRPGVSLTVPASGTQRSAWPIDLLYGGGIVLAALILALGFTTVRPMPRRREPRLPAPAWARGSRRGRL